MNNDSDKNLPESRRSGEPADKSSEHLRESLSALLDGELSTTEAAFLIKRMAHDAELNAQWQRFQGIGEVLRGHAEILENDNFSAQVLSRIAIAEAQLPKLAQIQPHQTISAEKPRFNRQKLSRFGAGIAIAAAVAWAALLLPQRSLTALEPPAVAQTAAPLTMASPVVSMRTVSGHIGGEVGSSSDQNNALLAQSMDAFLLEHVQRSPISPISDAVYLQNVAASDTTEMGLAPR